MLHESFRAGGVVSIFIGSFMSEAELDAYLLGGFPSDFGFVIDPPAGPEYDVSYRPADTDRRLAQRLF
jgi:hypothetical protein